MTKNLRPKFNIQISDIFVENEKPEEIYYNLKSDVNKDIFENSNEKPIFVIDTESIIRKYYERLQNNFNEIVLEQYHLVHQEKKLKEDKFNNTFNNNHLNISNSIIEDKSNYSCEVDYNENNIFKKSFENENRFNSIRIRFYLAHNLFDITLQENNENKSYPKKYKINDKRFVFLYDNSFKTYPIIISAFLFYTNKALVNNDIITQNFNSSLGLYFCGKNITIGNEMKKCSPNEFMCKSCMEDNKKRYNLKKHYFININGRVCKKNKGKYHCFGHFYIRNQIEDCITIFICNACKMIEKYSNYYENVNPN